MQSVVKFFLYLGLVSLILNIGGCFNKQSEKTNDKADKIITLERNETPFTAGDTLPTLANMVDKTTVVIYFANQNGQLVAEQREVPQMIGIAREALQQLMLGPRNKLLNPTIPAGTKLLDININNGLCTVDFSKELLTRHSEDPGSEYLTVYSIVNTLTQFNTIKEVQLRVAGKILDTIAGHVDVTTPLKRNGEIISTM